MNIINAIAMLNSSVVTLCLAEFLLVLGQVTESDASPLVNNLSTSVSPVLGCMGSFWEVFLQKSIFMFKKIISIKR